MTTSPAFQTSIDIINRGLQHLGQKRITALTDASKNAAETSFNYDKLREAELRRNIWRFAIRECTLTAIQDQYALVGSTAFNPTMVLVPETWSNTATYIAGAIVTYAVDGSLYQATGNIAAGVTPGTAGSGWVQYFGNLLVQAYDTTGATSYFSGQLVYNPIQNNPGVYISITNGNNDVPGTYPAWSATIPYKIGDTVVYNSVNYQSAEDLNINNTPTGAGAWIATPGTQTDVRIGQNWVKLGSTCKSLQLVYPIGAGPISQSLTQNIYQLPNGFLRQAPLNPKLGNTSYLGRPSAPLIDDYNLEGNYLLSGYSQPLYFRFVANVADVSQMDAMFCEGLAARIAIENALPLTQSADVLTRAEQLYKEFMSEARTVNGIETGSTEPALDDWIAARL